MRNDSAFDLANIPNLHLVEKARIAENGEWNLNAERYEENAGRASHDKMVKLGDVTKILNGYAFKSENYVERGIRIIRITNVQKGQDR